MGGLSGVIGAMIIAYTIRLAYKYGMTQINKPCKKGPGGFPYMCSNIFIKCMSGICLVLLSAFIVLIEIFLLPNDTLLKILLPVVPIILAAMVFSVIGLVKKFTLTQDELIYGAFRKKHILLSDLQKAAAVSPPCVYKEDSVVITLDELHSINFSLTSYYGSHDFFRMLAEALEIDIIYYDERMPVSAKSRFIGLGIAAYSIIVLMYIFSIAQ